MVPEATKVRPPKRARLHRWRRALQLATSFVLVIAPFVGLLRFDLKGKALIVFGVSFGLGEMSVVFFPVALAFVAVFAGALLYGRVYCGWMCPQTTLSELVGSLERWAHHRGSSPLFRQALTTASALALSAFVSASLVSYFLDPADRLSPPPLAWIGWTACFVVISGDLLFLRHRFCVGVCPYGILQNVIQDSKTLCVAFDATRRSECPDCMICVRACFMGVDIRQQGFAPDCLNCGDCLAASRLAKRCPAPPLIRFRYGAEPSRWPNALQALGILDARRVAVMALMVLGTAVFLGMLAMRRDLDFHVAALFDRATTEATGEVRNSYRVTMGNRLPQPVRVRIEVDGLPGVSVLSPQVVDLSPGERGLWDLVLQAPTTVTPGAHAITVRGVPDATPGGPTPQVAEFATRFFVPTRR